MEERKRFLSVNSGLFTIPRHTFDTDLVLLLIRIAGGYAFVLTGWGKIQHPMSWMGKDATVPGILQALAAISEFCGGLALILGILTRIAAFGIGCTMIGATVMMAIVMHLPYVNLQGGMSYVEPLTYLLIMLLLMVMGPGRFSIDRFIQWNRRTRNKEG